MRVRVQFYSYYRDLVGVPDLELDLPEGSTINDLQQRLAERYPKLGAMAKSTLVAVGVEYQPGRCQLKPGDEVALFPPVQGG